MRIKGSLLVAVCVLLLGIFGVVQSLTFHYWESTVLPLAVSSLIIVLAIIETGKELRFRYREPAAPEQDNRKDARDRPETKRLVLALGWVAGFSLVIVLLGFYIAIPVFIFSYLKWRGRSWLVAAVFAVAVLAFIYGIFEFGLKVPLFKGIIFGGH
jgi:di/tricarboxylate transporter